MSATKQIIEFIRRKDFVLKKGLGRGACGETVLLYDPSIDQHYVCKKYSPLDEQNRVALFEKFVTEIKLLHLLHHRNVVRVFNHYLYPEKYAGYILMEYINGTSIDEYIRHHPEAMSDVFEQVIEGFSHLESNSIIHRDIRYHNLLVTSEGIAKIIDFGFGKKALAPADFDKSISLNWWCPLPAEFADSIYDFRTEVYFVGMLFKQIMHENSLAEFRYVRTLSRMCEHKPENRIQSFSEVRKDLLTGRLQEIDFTDEELSAYREFSDQLHASVAWIETSAKYRDNPDEIQARLESYYKRVMLEIYIPQNSEICSAFINGQYGYYTKQLLVYVLKDFINLLRVSSPEKRSIVLVNICAKLDSVKRREPKFDDDIPF